MIQFILKAELKFKSIRDEEMLHWVKQNLNT